MSFAHGRAGRYVKRSLMIGMLGMLAAMTFAASASAAGSFVIGDVNVAFGAPVTFWGAQWARANPLSGGAAPASFKGFADTFEPPTCGSSWSTRPGNSSDPPPGPLPEFIDVIVSSQITKSGPRISGNTLDVVVVQTEPGYAPDPGHAGTGTVVGVVCSEGGPGA
jgi:hypothetical protein